MPIAPMYENLVLDLVVCAGLFFAHISRQLFLISKHKKRKWYWRIYVKDCKCLLDNFEDGETLVADNWISFGVLASEFSVEPLYLNSFAGERHDFFLKTSKG